MIRVRLRISDGPITDTTEYGLVYLDSDKRVGNETKGFEATSYPEEEGEHIYPKTVFAPFEYTVKFFIQADPVEDGDTDAEKHLKTINAKIDAFNHLLYDEDEDGQLTFHQVAFFNDLKRHKIVGYPQLMSNATDFWRDPSRQVNDIAVVEWVIRVTKPSLCEYKTPFSDDTGD